MSNAISHSRSSIDLGVHSTSTSDIDCLPTDTSPSCVPQPPRLQHSPSLPNIWFPQHSGVISREKATKDQTTMHGLSAPPSPKTKQSTAIEKEPQTRHVKYASIDPTYRKPSGTRTHTRRRTERDEPHSLLTPPLTPSSSIRTTASLDSSTGGATVPITEEIIDADSDSTRILLLENVSPDIDLVSLEAVVTSELSKTVTEKTAATDGARPSFTPDGIVKGINARLHRDQGIVPMVFFDVRSAKTARDVILSKKLDDRPKETIGDVGHGKSQSTELAARLISLEELFKINRTLGHSRFLDGIDASFTLSVQKTIQKDNTDSRSDKQGPEVDEHDQSNSKMCSPKEDPLARGGINIAILQDILKSFGSIRFLKFVQQEVDQQGNTSVVYRIEYHDLRHAESACRELKDQTMFGMKISVIRGNNPGSNSVAAVEPFLNSSTARESFDGLSIQTAGVQSQLRQRFAYTVSDGGSAQDQSIEAQPISVQPNPPSGEAGSPTFFYTTTTFEPSLQNQNLQVTFHEQGPPQGRGAFPEVGRTPNLQMVPHNPMIQEQQQQQWEPEPFFRAECISPTYPAPDGTTCIYCPSRGTPHGHGTAYPSPFPPYAFSPSPPTPSVYYPGPLGNPMPHMVNVVPSPSPPILGYEGYVEPHMHPMPQNGAWNYDPNIAPVNMGMMPNAISPAPFFIRGSGPPPRSGGARYPGTYPRPPNGLHQQQQMEHGPPRLQIEGPQGHGNDGTPHLSTPDTMSPSSNHSAALASGDASGVLQSSVSAGNDRNQLNLARVRSGEDTRTTVMIKNIPNKMSDADLTAYIAKVCPRKIDFLYLRMDFKNGCNVGYAFVNFIRVQDLLHFANERLGAKWNMFSSEKVLQMSYANYQGKEALVEKFKNSAIMDERESWRPRIFYSSGPNEGLPEPFPSPTHIRRKERSSYNRDTLFPPGVNSHSIAAQSHGGGLLQNNHTPRRYRDDTSRSAVQNHGRLGANERFQPHGHGHGHGRHADGSGEGRREQRTLVFRNFNQRTTAR